MENPILLNYFVDLFLTHQRGFILLEENSDNSNNSDDSNSDWSSNSTLKNSEIDPQYFSEDSDSEIEWHLSHTPCNSRVSSPLTEYSDNSDENLYSSDNGSDYSYDYYSD